MKLSRIPLPVRIFFVSFFLVQLFFCSRGVAQGHAMKVNHDWVLVYYMSYDNNLSPFGEGILESLKNGVQNSSLVVTVLMDDRNRDGLKRYAITRQGVEVERLATDDSADAGVFASYMEWVRIRYPARHYAVVFLDHGGRLDEMCLDEWPGPGKSRAWLSAKSVASVLEKFRLSVLGEVELLFLQQCGRGSIDNLYSFRGSAAVIMASQENVGAPNTYYELTLKWLASNTEAGGVSLAQQVMVSDRDYSSYVCVSSKALSDLPDRVAPVITALLHNKEAELRLPEGLNPSFHNADEHNYDLFEWLEAAFLKNAVPSLPLRRFEAWVKRDLILALSTKGLRATNSVLSGLSLFVPRTKSSWDMYTDYPIYQNSSLRKLWESLYGSSVYISPL
jgi:hypothetical protein